MSTLKSSSVLSLLLSLGLPIFGQTPTQEDPRALMFRARAKQMSGSVEDLAGAVTLYRKVVALVPGSSEAQLRLSESLAEAGDMEGAVAPAIKSTELNPRNGEAWFNLGVIQSQRSSSLPAARKEAARAFTEASIHLPDDPEVWYRLALTDQALSDDEGALTAWTRLGRLHLASRYGDPSKEQYAWENAALLAAKLNLYEPRREAIMSLCQLDNPNPKHLLLLEDLAREQADKGFLGHAEESFILLGEHFPKEPAVWENVARIQMQTNRFDEALTSYNQAEALKPSTRISYFKGFCLMSLGRLAEAESVWKTLLAMDPPVGDADIVQNVRYFYAASLLLQRRPAEMLELIQSWPGYSGQAELLALKAEGLIQTQAWKAARAVLEDGMKRFPQQPLFHDAKAMPPELLQEGLVFKKKARQALVQLDLESVAALWSEFRQWTKCLEMIQQARNAGPVTRVGLLMLESNALDEVGQGKKAIEALREAQKMDPAFPMLHNNLGYLLLENGGDLAEASRLIEAAMKEDPKNGSTVDSWGWVLYKQGKLKESEEALRKAVDLSPYSPEIRSHLGQVLLALNRPEEALENWERALAFAFPERMDLEKKAQKLRAELAKKKLEQQSTAGQANDDDAPDDEETP